jgi:gliding motility-associated-like protein
MKKIILIIMLLTCVRIWSQTVSPQVINAAGDHRQVGSSGIWITDNVGEPFTETIGSGNLMITQGFLQPPVNDGVTIAFNGLTCTDRDDGFISIAFSSLNETHTETYEWSPPVACPAGACGNKVSNLKADKYYVKIISTYTTNNGTVKTDTIRRGPIEIANSPEPCRIKIYSGVTANGDGNNDKWIIENITEFPNNRVTLYNRWGLQLYDVKGYDNDTKAWPTRDQASKLVASTYFYIVDLGDGSKPIKGWVELIKN